jgi:hypothetical protein
MSYISVSCVVPTFQHCVPLHCKLLCVASRSADISDGTLLSPWSLHGFQSSNPRNVNSTCVGGGRRGVQDNFLSIVVSTVIEICKWIWVCSMKSILWRLQLFWVNKMSVPDSRKTIIILKTEAFQSIISVYEASSPLKSDAVYVNKFAVFRSNLQCLFSVCKWP